ncbi:serine hydrolase domain-containing protein [Promicromonospora sukumoe]|uniref:serine hydrolase domain-containing protein n=1 Tax=Promicromonospora sukumoe TaxID=88382 RepID=UPI0003636B7D|nr:serine hydrolase domain-containing protein [Promicromonospora sukumoe]
MEKTPLTRHLAAALLTLGLAAAGAGPAAAASVASAAGPTPEAIDAYLVDLHEASGVPGLSAVVTHGDRVVHAAGYGHDSTGAPVTAQTPMRIASVSKSFTAMAVLVLAEDGAIDLDAPVTRQLPELELADPRVDEITVRQLLDQTSGFSDTTVDVADLAEATSRTDYVARLHDDALATDPGTAYHYCNVNFDVAARLVEVASGQPFGDFLAERVLQPLGMTGTATRDDVVRPADGYTSLFGAWVPRQEPAWFDDTGSAGVITTADDLGRWLIAQTGNGPRLVAPATLDAAHTPSAVGPYGLGWHTEDDGTAWHSGFVMTYRAVEWIDPATGYGIAVMTNGAGLTDVTRTALDGLVALTRGETPDAADGTRTADLVLGALLLASAALGVVGVRRAPRWATRQAGRARWRTGLRLAWLLLPALLLAYLPALAGALSGGRTFPWSSLAYFALPVVLTLLVAALAGLGVLGVRIGHLARRRPVGSPT